MYVNFIKTEITMTRFTKAIVLLMMVGTLAACHKDDDNNDEPQPIDPASQQDANADSIALADKYTAIATVMSKLTGATKLEGDFATNTYEPTYGQADDDNATTRVVVLETVDAAEADFLGIIGNYGAEFVDKTTDGQTFSLKDIPTKDGGTFDFGTMAFHRGDGTASLGYVEVSIPAIPHLERIEYKTAAAIGDNATSPFLKGDIIDCSSNYCTGYYLCVREYNSGQGVLVHFSINEQGGDESINLDGDSDGCWYPYNVSKGHTATLDEIRAYADFMLTEKGKLELIKNYLDGDLVEQPSRSGKMWHLFPEGFNNTEGVVFHSSDWRGARIRYDATWQEISYYWWDWRVSKYFEVPQNCSNIFDISEGSFRYIEDGTWDSHYSEKWNYTMNVIHFGSTAPAGCKKVFSPVSGSNTAHKDDAVNAEKRHLGWCYADNNRLYENASKAKLYGHTPLGIVVYVSDGSSNADRITEGFGHGLVMSYFHANSVNGTAYTTRWNPGGDVIVDDYITSSNSAFDDYDGLAKTDELAFIGSPAAKAVKEYTPKAPGGYKTSDWFIPSVGQWVAILCSPGLGGVAKPSSKNGMPVNIENGSINAYNNIDKYLTGTYFHKFSDRSFWTSSSWKGYGGIMLRNYNGTSFGGYSSGSYAFARPVFAF